MSPLTIQAQKMGDYSLASQKVILLQNNNGSILKTQSMKPNVVWNGSRSQRRRPIVYRLGRKMKTKQKHDTSPQFDESNTTTIPSNNYQPRLFQDIVGQNIVVKTLCNAVKKKMIAPLYLFHGPHGTGKTSTARVFAMALNCESDINKPCCTCKGCSRSLYTMELCSGNKSFGCDKVKMLLQNISFVEAIPGFKVFIIEECHLLTLEAWNELMSLLQGENGSNLVFLFITHRLDVNSITGNISSRCQKFYFSKLNNDDVTKKLSRIISNQSIVIEKEALKLIVAKSNGSLRDAENILDQLALLGPTITTSMAQQLVGLIPNNKLLDLLAMAVSGDTVNTIRYAKELSECVEPSSFVSQLASLVTNLLSEDSTSSSSSSANTKLLSKTHSEKLCYILKLLVETERQLQSPSTYDRTSNIIATIFLDINSKKASKTENSVLPTRRQHSTTEMTLYLEEIVEQLERRRDAKRGSLSDVEQVWKDVLKGIENSHTQKFLLDRSKLTQLSISKTNAIVHLTFTRPEDKMAAEISEETLAKALEFAIGCPVTLHMSLEESLTSGQVDHTKTTLMNPLYTRSQNASASANTNTNSEGLSLTKSKSCSISQRPCRNSSNRRNLNITHMYENPNSDTHVTKAKAGNFTQSMRVNKPRHRWLSLSLIPKSDASVEPYSQDVKYEKSTKDKDDLARKFQKGLSKSSKDQCFQDQIQSNPAWCC